LKLNTWRFLNLIIIEGDTLKERCELLLLKIVGILKMYCIYIVIMFVSVLVRAIPFSSGNLSLDGTINDIAIGAFASTLVAWLVFVHDQKQMKNRNRELCEYTISPLLEALINYMQNFCRSVAIEDVGMRSETHTFSEWSSLYFSRLSKSTDSPTGGFHGMDKDFLKASLDRICVASKRILSNEIWFQKEEVMEKEECDLIYEIETLCESANLFTINDQATMNVNMINQELCKIIQQSKWRALIEVKYSHYAPLENHFTKRGMKK